MFFWKNKYWFARKKDAYGSAFKSLFVNNVTILFVYKKNSDFFTDACAFLRLY